MPGSRVTPDRPNTRPPPVPTLQLPWAEGASRPAIGPNHRANGTCSPGGIPGTPPSGSRQTRCPSLPGHSPSRPSPRGRAPSHVRAPAFPSLPATSPQTQARLSPAPPTAFWECCRILIAMHTVNFALDFGVFNSHPTCTCQCGHLRWTRTATLGHGFESRFCGEVLEVRLVTVKGGAQGHTTQSEPRAGSEPRRTPGCPLHWDRKVCHRGR